MKSNQALGFAILGAGMVAEYHQQAVLANADIGANLVAVSHYDPQRFQNIESQFGVPCRSYDEVLADERVDVVCICTPSGQHAEQAIAAAAAGQHVLVEKPMALSLAEADQMIAACAEAGVQLGVMLQRRADPTLRRVHDAVRAGDLGDLTLAVVTMPYLRPDSYYDQAAWRGTWALDGGGVLMNQGIHIVDLLVWLMGDPVEISAYGDTLRRQVEVEDTLAAVLRFESGALATITATTTASPGFPHRVEIYGDGGAIQIEGEEIRRWTLVDPASATVEPLTPRGPGEVDAGAGSDPRGIKPTGHIELMRDFIQAIRSGSRPTIDGAEGRRSLAAVLGIYQAAGLKTA